MFTSNLSTSIGQVRYRIGDDTQDAGVLPNGANFSDEQIQFELDAVGQSVPGACARLCANLARRWSTLPQSFTADGLSINRGDMVAKWNGMKADFENEAGGGATFGTITLDRQDAYSVYWGQSGNELTRDE
jgi:hypothetical protein